MLGSPCGRCRGIRPQCAAMTPRDPRACGPGILVAITRRPNAIMLGSPCGRCRGIRPQCAAMTPRDPRACGPWILVAITPRPNAVDQGVRGFGGRPEDVRGLGGPRRGGRPEDVCGPQWAASRNSVRTHAQARVNPTGAT